MSHSVHDVAAYILKKQGEMSAMKLQKLVYYSQAWSLVWDEKPLFKAKIEAWANGPVVRSLYEKHRGQFLVKTWPDGDRMKITGKAKETIDSVLSFYGDKTGQWLSELTHKERPWRDARKGLADDERCDKEITSAALAEYYGSL
ncbi:MAG TPA: type II toxin-antitoxin system antitoxin SocA domain-containing protein [Luteolibacter sp.]